MANGNSKAADKPYVISGRGKDRAPSGTFCLFADIGYNTSGSRDKILVIPAKGTANNFSDYGFDQSDDGVSSVVNNTDKDNILFTRTNQGGSQLPVPAGSSIEDLTKYPLDGSSTGTWNDQAQSALAYSLPVPLPVFTDPKASTQTQNHRQPVSGTADSNVSHVLLYEQSTQLATCPVKDSKWEYVPASDWSLGQHDLSGVAVRDGVQSGKAYLCFYVILPTPVVNIRSPQDGADVDSKTPIDGIAFNADTVNLAEGSTQLGVAKVASDKWSFSREEEWSLGDHSVTAVAVRGGQESAQDTVHFTVSKKNLTVDFKLNRDPWQDWKTQKWIYSYDITLYAGDTDVKHWNIGFGQLPDGSILFEEFTSHFWGMIIEDGSHGAVLLGSPPEGVHIVSAHGSLTIRVLVLIPVNDPAYRILYGLFAKAVGA